jgi:hypothetical protein
VRRVRGKGRKERKEEEGCGKRKMVVWRREERRNCDKSEREKGGRVRRV